MSLDTKNDPSQDGVQALLTRLKEHPDERSRPADEIAEEFGLSPAFVRRVLERAEVPANAEIHPFLVSFSALRGWFDKADGWLDEASVHPSAFVVTTTLCSELLISLVGWISGHRILGMEVQNGAVGELSGGGIAIIVLVAISQMLVFFKRAMVRHAIYGALISWVLDDLLTSPASPANGLPSALRAVTDPKAHEPSAAHGDPNDVLQDMQPIASGPSRGAVGNAADATGPQVRRGRGGKAMQQIMDGIMELVEVHTAANGRSAYVNGILPTR